MNKRQKKKHFKEHVLPIWKKTLEQRVIKKLNENIVNDFIYGPPEIRKPIKIRKTKTLRVVEYVPEPYIPSNDAFARIIY